MIDYWFGHPDLVLIFRAHPRYLVTDDSLTAIELWQAMQGGLAGGGSLPFPGGLLEQPAAILESFKILNSARTTLDRTKPTKK